MKIIDTFLFSEPFEANLLWLKLSLEEAFVHEWVILENEYTFQGEYKGLWAESVLTKDERFSKFRDRIRIIQGAFKPQEVYNQDGVFDQITLRSEDAQRELARAYILKTYTDEDYVLISDVDEMLDCTCTEKIEMLSKKIEQDKKGIVRIPRTRFWYDFDNLWLMSRSTPLVSVRLLREDSRPVGVMRKQTTGPSKEWPRKVLFEYSFCFTRKEIMRKYDSQSHTGYKLDDIQRGLLCNHVPVSSLRDTQMSLDPSLWLEKIELNEKNSPALVRDNLSTLKVNSVDNEYVKNRMLYYPEFFPRRGFRRILMTVYKKALEHKYKMLVNCPRARRWYKRIERSVRGVYKKMRTPQPSPRVNR